MIDELANTEMDYNEAENSQEDDDDAGT